MVRARPEESCVYKRALHAFENVDFGALDVHKDKNSHQWYHRGVPPTTHTLEIQLCFSHADGATRTAG